MPILRTYNTPSLYGASLKLAMLGKGEESAAAPSFPAKTSIVQGATNLPKATHIAVDITRDSLIYTRSHIS